MAKGVESREVGLEWQIRAAQMRQIPASVVVASVKAAVRQKLVEMGDWYSAGKDGSPDPTHSERHPAIMTLCEWWNSECPAPRLARAASVALYVPLARWTRSEEDGKSAIHGLVPTMRASKTACCGNLLVVDFYQSSLKFDYKLNETKYMLVDGCVGGSVKICGKPGDGEYIVDDFGYYGLDKLQGFEERFPRTWRMLCQAAERETVVLRKGIRDLKAKGRHRVVEDAVEL